MMKLMFALVLLHLCQCGVLNTTLNEEMIGRLDQLNSRVNITSPVRLPTWKMIKNASSCLGVFVRELKDLLTNVTVLQEDDKVTLQELKANLEALGQHKENDTKCLMTQRKPSQPFKPYAKFLRRLNNYAKR